MIFDDYLWEQSGNFDHPKLGIDAFMQAYRGYYNIIHMRYQLVIQKTRDIRI